MEKIFTVVEIPDEKIVNIGMFYLTEEVYIWWNTMNDKLLWPEFTQNKIHRRAESQILPSFGLTTEGKRVHGTKDGSTYYGNAICQQVCRTIQIC